MKIKLTKSQTDLVKKLLKPKTYIFIPCKVEMTQKEFELQRALGTVPGEYYIVNFVKRRSIVCNVPMNFEFMCEELLKRTTVEGLISKGLLKKVPKNNTPLVWILNKKNKDYKKVIDQLKVERAL